MRWRSHTSPRLGASCSVMPKSHIATDECGAPEFFGAGLKLVGLPGAGAKITPDALAAALKGYGGHSPHQMIASALSLTQASEAGTVYRPDEIAALCAIAHERVLAVHMDGARLANALVRFEVTPAQMTWRSGIDVLSFGATKAGALAAEAVVFFDTARAAFFAERRKRAGHLLSKHRFLAAQFDAALAEDRWLKLARHANAMADRLAQKLAPSASLRLGPWKPISSSSLCHAPSTHGSRPRAPATTCGRAKVWKSTLIASWCGSLPRSRPGRMRWIASLLCAKNSDRAQAAPQFASKVVRARASIGARCGGGFRAGQRNRGRGIVLVAAGRCAKPRASAVAADATPGIITSHEVTRIARSAGFSRWRRRCAKARPTCCARWIFAASSCASWSMRARRDPRRQQDRRRPRFLWPANRNGGSLRIPRRLWSRHGARR